jgi:hypothetical protein
MRRISAIRALSGFGTVNNYTALEAAPALLMWSGHSCPLGLQLPASGRECTLHIILRPVFRFWGTSDRLRVKGQTAKLHALGVICPLEDRLPLFSNCECPYASLTGGTQFVTVNQSFTNILAELSSVGSWNCRPSQISGSGRRFSRRGAAMISIPKMGSQPKKIPVVPNLAFCN